MRILPIAALALLAPAAALAHPGHGEGGHFAEGLAHPLLGADHVLAMVAVGLWAALAGGQARWAYPLTFLAAMLAAGHWGAGAGALPVIEPLILASVILLGAACALMLRAPLPLALGLIAVFGAAHGYAHGVEGPGGAGYAFGFLLATAALHGLGYFLAFLGQRTARGLGGALALGGAALAVFG